LIAETRRPGTMSILKTLIANRGEIAVRIIRVAHELGLMTAQVFSQADREMLAVKLADEAVEIGPPQAAKSYLSAEAILRAAASVGADAIHPLHAALVCDADVTAARFHTRWLETWLATHPLANIA
jgi:acetyl-CoA carboxylase biotin carboxylase subunit